MKSRRSELLRRSIHAAVAAIEIYNKPNFLYREESFSVLMINSWELLIKAKWLSENNNRIGALYSREPIKKKDGSIGKKLVYKLTRSGFYQTHGLEFIAKKLLSQNKLHANVWNNIQGLIEVRDTAVHFYNDSSTLPVRIHELGSASISNYTTAIYEWFGESLREYNLSLMPLAFVSPPKSTQGIVTTKEEKNLLAFIESLQKNEGAGDGRYTVFVNVKVRLHRSAGDDGLGVKVTNNKDALEVKMSDEQFREKYPIDYKQLTKQCRTRYLGFKEDSKFTRIRKTLCLDPKYAQTRYLDSLNPKSAKKVFYSSNIWQEFDKHYQLSPKK